MMPGPNGIGPTRSRQGNRLLTCCGFLVGLPVAAGLILGAIFSLHNRRPELVIPSHALPKPNGYDDFVRAGQLASAMQHKAPASMIQPPSQAQLFGVCAACAKDIQPAHSVLRRALREPYFHPAIRSAFDAFTRNDALFREMARELTGEAEYYEYINQPGKAADTLLDGMEMGATLPRGGSLITDLVGIAVEAICARPLDRIIPRLSPQELRHVLGRLDRIEAKRSSFADVLTEDKWTNAATILEFIQNPNIRPLAILTGHGIGPDGFPTTTWSERWDAIGFAFVNKEKLLREFLSYEDAEVPEARRPYHLGASVSAPNSVFTFDALREAWPKHLIPPTVARLLRTEVALYLYRAEHARFPTSLAALVPRYLPAIPVDPFTGAARRPFRYRPKSTGFLLYSVGPDMRDDGGMPVRYPADKPGDIVAGRMWPVRKRP